MIPSQSMKPTTAHNNMPRMQKSEDTPAAPLLPQPGVPPQRLVSSYEALPSSQQSKGYASVNFEWTPLLLPDEVSGGASGDMKRWLPQRSPVEEISGYPFHRCGTSRLLNPRITGHGPMKVLAARTGVDPGASLGRMPFSEPNARD